MAIRQIRVQGDDVFDKGMPSGKGDHTKDRDLDRGYDRYHV